MEYESAGRAVADISAWQHFSKIQMVQHLRFVFCAFLIFGCVKYVLLGMHIFTYLNQAGALESNFGHSGTVPRRHSTGQDFTLNAGSARELLSPDKPSGLAR